MHKLSDALLKRGQMNDLPKTFRPRRKEKLEGKFFSCCGQVRSDRFAQGCQMVVFSKQKRKNIR
jgi:hypothetical protein